MITTMHADQNASPPRVEVITSSPAASPLADRREDPAGRGDDAARDANKLTLERHTGRRPGRTHDGVVIALRSNIRWCSDHFELACRNGEIVRVLFAIDACDREVMGWLATSTGISGEMVRDLMIACVERRIRDQQGGASRRMVVRQRLGVHRQGHARHRNCLGPQALFHASPLAKSNGIAEAFVKINMLSKWWAL